MPEAWRLPGAAVSLILSGGRICYAKQNRQDAVKELAARVGMVIVVGSQNSSNSNRLREVAQNLGVPRANSKTCEHRRHPGYALSAHNAPAHGMSYQC
jgi:hypothetical protein